MKQIVFSFSGLSATQNNGFLCVLQLTETGDIFYQLLRHFDPTSAEPHQSDSVEAAVNTDSAVQPHASLEEDSEFESERHQRMLSQVERVVSDCDDEEGPCTSGETQVRIPTEKGINSGPEPSMRKGTCARPLRPAVPKMASRKLNSIWRKWLDSLLTQTARGQCEMKHKKIKTSVIMKCKVQQKDKLEEDKFQRLRKDLAEILKTRKLLVHGLTYLPSLELTPVPDEVDPKDWRDDLSQRISASWRDGWSNWWEEKLGLNRDAKIKALWRKHHQAKRARARNRVALSSSFTSSVSYQDDFSEYSSATSQYLGSDAESISYSQSAPDDDLEKLSNSTVLSGVSQTTKGSSDVREPTKTSLKRPQNARDMSEQDKAVGTSHSPPKDFQQLPRQAPAMDGNSVLFSSPVTRSKASCSDHSKPRWQQQQQDNCSSSHQETGQDDEIAASPHLIITRSQSSSFLSPLRASFRSPSRTSQPPKKKSRMGF